MTIDVLPALAERLATAEVAADTRLSPTLLDHRALELPPLDPPARRIWKDRRLMHHHRLVFLVLLANFGVLSWLAGHAGVTATTAANAVLGNLALTVLARQQRLINLFFRVATSAPTSWPLRWRWTLGKVYHFGGLHVGGALSTTAWFAASAVLAEREGDPGAVERGLSALVILLLLALVGTAAPRFRAARHDLFEQAHRYGGWMALLLFGVHSVIATATSTPGGLGAGAILHSPALWVFALVVLSVTSTWWDLRRVPVSYERPSSHVVIASFGHRTTFAGSSTALSRRPLREWHHFANVHTPGSDGFRLTISRSGNWTGGLIDDLPETVWVKGIPTAGVGNIDRLFTRVLWVATGSGIGPCLPHLLVGDTPATLVWSTRSPRTTYGDTLVDEILTAQPDAVVWDTTALGKPDLVKLAFAAYEERGAEAVICISNKPTTWSVVEAFEKRGIPAYGAIWDS